MEIWPLNESTMDNKLDSSNLFVSRIPNFNIDKHDLNFYNFLELENKDNACDSNSSDNE